MNFWFPHSRVGTHTSVSGKPGLHSYAERGNESNDE